mgnify:CR=1 FL=1
MRGDVETVKERLEIAEIVGNYTKLEKAGASFKARCPFHNEKTPSFFISPARGSYYCFGCGAKGDIFTFVQELEGLSFKEALKMLAEKAGVELDYRPEAQAARSEKEKIHAVLETAMQFFEKELKENPAAQSYLHGRGIDEKSVKYWRLGYAPAEWRALYTHLLQLGYTKELLLKAGLVKPVDGTNAKATSANSGSPDSRSEFREPYDVFRDRLIFPLADASGEPIAFSGRALAKETEPKYLNSPDTIVFKKQEVLYGLDKAKEKIRRKDYAVLVEGQVDLVLSHQAGVDNTVASSGTAFTQAHLERLKRLSKRIILAFDGDKAGLAAAEKAAELALFLGLEVKIAKLPEGKDPADVAHENGETWKQILRDSKPAIEHFLELAIVAEKDKRKLGKILEYKILPLVALLESSIEKSHFLSLIAKRTGIKEEVLWEDLRRTRRSEIGRKSTEVFSAENLPSSRADALRDPFSSQLPPSRKSMLEERLTEVRTWLKELGEKAPERKDMEAEEAELLNHLALEALHVELSELTVILSQAETSKKEDEVKEVMKRIAELHKELRALEG